MASTKFSGVGVVALNGSVGDDTYTFNAYGQYVKAKPGTPAGGAHLAPYQTQLQSIVNVWEVMLTDADRLPWYQYALDWFNPLYHKKKITGFNAFVSVNMNLFVAGRTGIIVPPVHEVMTRITFMEDSGSFNLKVGTDGPTCDILYYCSNQLPPGRMSNNQLYYFMQVSQGVGGLDLPNLSAAWTTYFSVAAPTAGNKVFVKAVTQHKVEGVRGPAQYVTMQF